MALYSQVQQICERSEIKAQAAAGRCTRWYRHARRLRMPDPMKVPFSRTRPSAAPTPDAPPAEQTAVAPAVTPSTPQPAPAVPPLDPPPAEPASAVTGNRPKLRRRLRYLRRAHELGLRDLGGLVFDLHRFSRRNDQLVAAKLHALDAIDREMRAIDAALGTGRDVVELHEAGITACVRCGGLHGTDARFCPACGTEVAGPVAVSVAPTPAPAGEPTAVHSVPTPSPAPVPAASTPVATPPVPSTGPAPAAPPLWSVPQPQADKPDEGDPASADPAS